MNQEIGKESEDKAKEILELSDLVKFAKYKPVDEENRKVVTLSREFIESTMLVYESEVPDEAEDLLETNDLETENEATETQNSEEKK